MDDTLSSEELVERLLGELDYVHETGNVGDSIANSYSLIMDAKEYLNRRRSDPLAFIQ